MGVPFSKYDEFYEEFLPRIAEISFNVYINLILSKRGDSWAMI